MNITLQQAADELLAAKKLVLAAHINPDGDAVGSTLALMHALHALGKEAKVFIDDKIPSIFSVLPGHEKIKRPPEKTDEKISADLLVILDANPDRIGRVLDFVNAPIINIDHHVSNAGGDFKLYLDADKAATSEILYELIKEMRVDFSYAIAACLYTGIATDSGFFRYANTKPFTMRAAAELMEYGVKPNEISEATETKSFATVKGMAAAIDTMETFCGGKAAGIFLDLPLVSTLETTEGFIDVVRTVEGVDLALMVKCQGENFCRISMRSKTLDVAKIAVGFGGGGHIRAAGCTLKMSFADAKKTIVAAIEKAFAESENG